MYVPPYYALDESTAWARAREVGAGFLVVATAAGPRSVFAPVLFDEGARTLRGHVARGNSWWSDAANGDEVLALFHAADAYVSPLLYPTRAEKAAVPTWDYVLVEVRGRLAVRDDRAFVDGVVRDLTDLHERSLPEPWSVDDAPPAYVDKLLGAIVGFEIAVTEVHGAAKLNQTRPVEDRASVREAFARGSDRERAVAREMDGA